MARFMVKASEYKNVCKAVNDRELAELKKEIIEILKKQDEKEFKKAIDYLNSQELYYTHLEKSITTGKWVEKAGYGIGTVRTWKGKKYKKVAQGNWVRVFDKESRGTSIAIGKLIAKVQKINNVEDLMALVMENKQRFVDENGMDLPVLDKLRAAVDARNGNVGSKETSKPAEKKETDYSKMSEDELNELNKKLRQTIKEKDYGEADEEIEQINKISKQKIINSYKTREKHTLQHIEDVEQKKKMIADSKAIVEKDLARKEKQRAKESSIEKKNQMADEIDDLKYKKAAFEQLAKEIDNLPEKESETENEVPFGGVDKTDEGEGKEALAMADKINEVAEKGELKVGDETFKVDKEGKEWAVRTEIMNAIKCKDAIDNINKNFDKAAKKKLEEDLKEKLDKIKAKLPDVVKEGKLEENKKIVEERLKNYSQFGTTIDEVVEKYKKDLISKIENHVKDNQLFTSRNTDDIELLGDLEHQVELASYKGSGVFYTECKKLLDGYKEESEAGSEESDYVQKKRDAEEGYWSDEFKERNMNNIKQKIAAMKEEGASDKKIKAYLEETIETNTNDIPWRERAIEEGRIKGNQANDYRDTIQERTVRIENCKELLKEYESETKEKTDFDVEAYKKSKKKLEDTIADIDKKIQLYDSNPTPNGMRMAQQLENQKKEWQKQLENLETQKKDYKKSVLGELLLLEGIEEQKEDEEEFLLDNILEEDIDDMAKEKEEESLFNDYTAEEPEEFNSTEFMVREALNRRFNCL